MRGFVRRAKGARCDSITERLLSATYARRAERVIVDLTSVSVFEVSMDKRA